MDGCCCCCTRRLQPPRPIRKRKADDVNYVLWPRFSKKIDLNPLYSFFFYFLFVFSLSSSLCLQLCCVLILAKNAAFRSRKWKNIGKGRLSSSSFFFCRMSQKVIFRPPFINGRPQETDFIFGRALVPFFETKPPFFSFTSFSFTSFVRGH